MLLIVYDCCVCDFVMRLKASLVVCNHFFFIGSELGIHRISDHFIVR